MGNDDFFARRWVTSFPIPISGKPVSFPIKVKPFIPDSKIKLINPGGVPMPPNPHTGWTDYL